MVDPHRSDRRQRLVVGYPLTERYFCCRCGAGTHGEASSYGAQRQRTTLSSRPSPFSRPLTHHATGTHRKDNSKLNHTTRTHTKGAKKKLSFVLITNDPFTSKSVTVVTMTVMQQTVRVLYVVLSILL